MKRKVIAGIFILLTLCMTGCSKKNEEWTDSNGLGDIDEAAEVQEITDDFSESTELDKVLALPKLQEQIHYASLQTLFTDAYNATLLPHETQLTQIGYWHSSETTEETGRYNFASNGVMWVKAENEKILAAEFTTSLEMTKEEQTAYAINMIYHIVPNVTKNDLTHLYQSIMTWKTENSVAVPSFTRGNYTVSFEDSMQGFHMIIKTLS